MKKKDPQLALDELLSRLTENQYSPFTLKSYRVNLQHFTGWLQHRGITDLLCLKHADLLSYRQFVLNLPVVLATKRKCLLVVRRLIQRQVQLQQLPADLGEADLMVIPSSTVLSHTLMGNLISAILLDMRLQQYSTSMIDSTRKSLNHFNRWMQSQGLEDAGEITEVLLAQYWQQVISKLSRDSRPSRLCAIKRLFAYLKANGKILFDPTASITLTTSKHRLPRTPLTQQEMQNLLAQPDVNEPFGLRDRAFIEVLYSTAMRVGELAQLKLAHIDFTQNLILIPCGKGSKARMVPLGRHARAWVQRYIEQARGLWLTEDNQEYVFLTQHRHPMQVFMYRERLLKYGRQSAIQKPVSPHVIRHTCATHLLQQGSHISIIQVLLGHARIGTTELYTHLMPTEIKAMHEHYHPLCQPQKE